MGKIIRIAIAGHANTVCTQSEWTLIALCDDGRLWGMTNTGQWGEIPLPESIGNKPKSEVAIQCNLDSDQADQARALHRVVRAMHDGHCPKCSCLGSADAFIHSNCHRCPECGFTISASEAELALQRFRPYLNKSVEVFEQWRTQFQGLSD